MADNVAPYNKSINFAEKLSKFNDHWSPKVIAEMNDYQFKLVKVLGDFVWHKHDDTDETFIILDGSMRIDYRDHIVELSQGELCVVKKGDEHKPFAEVECSILLIEPKGVVNTGDATEDTKNLTAANDAWIWVGEMIVLKSSFFVPDSPETLI